MSKAEYAPCRIEGQFVKACVSLASAVDDQRVKFLTYSNMESGAPTRSMVVLRSGAHRKAGIVMNHCPFCGENISRHLTEESAS